MNEKAHAVAVVGCGTVGGSTADLLIKDRCGRQKRSNPDLYLKYIVDKDFGHARSSGLPGELFCDDLQRVLDDPEIETVVELVGGTGFARELSIRAMNAGKHLVTANKALLAHHGRELFSIARKNGVSLAFEASCGGGIPIIRALTDGLVANDIDALFGIVNGTCNYILTEMIDKGQSYSQALDQAQAIGLAEADPKLDVNGTDSAHKITIMGSLAFGESASLDKVPVQGIDKLESIDLKFGAEMGYVIKLMASAIKIAEGMFLRVEPAFITTDHPLAWVSGAFNAISVYGHSLGHTMYYGRGAGGSPTASAVVADVMSIANGSYPRIFASLKMWPDLAPTAKQIAPGKIQRSYYLRFFLHDRTGILAEVTKILADNDISLRSILQHEAPQEPPPGLPVDGAVPLVITTHRTQEASILQAIENIKKIDGVKPEYSSLPILDEHPEFSSQPKEQASSRPAP